MVSTGLTTFAIGSAKFALPFPERQIEAAPDASRDLYPGGATTGSFMNERYSSTDQVVWEEKLGEMERL